jgi:hypothetical protein
MARTKKRGDIDADYHAIRSRLKTLGTVNVVASTTIPPHTHSAEEIGMTAAGLLAADDVQEGLEELDSEKLARDGTQTMLGALDMNAYSINNIDDADIEGTATIGEDVVFTEGVGGALITNPRMITMAGAVGEGVIANARMITMAGAVGEGVIANPRVITMAGDKADDEAKIQNLERVVFNNEPTASSIEGPSRIDMRVGVTAGVDYTAAEGIVSWDTLEDTLVLYVLSGPGA